MNPIAAFINKINTVFLHGIPKILTVCNGSEAVFLCRQHKGHEALCSFLWIETWETSKKCKDSVIRFALIAWAVYSFLFLGNSHDLYSKKWYFSATLRFIIQYPSEVLRKKIRVAPDTDSGRRNETHLLFHCNASNDDNGKLHDNQKNSFFS